MRDMLEVAVTFLCVVGVVAEVLVFGQRFGTTVVPKTVHGLGSKRDEVIKRYTLSAQRMEITAPRGDFKLLIIRQRRVILALIAAANRVCFRVVVDRQQERSS